GIGAVQGEGIAGPVGDATAGVALVAGTRQVRLEDVHAQQRRQRVALGEAAGDLAGAAAEVEDARAFRQPVAIEQVSLLRPDRLRLVREVAGHGLVAHLLRLRIARVAHPPCFPCCFVHSCQALMCGCARSTFECGSSVYSACGANSSRPRPPAIGTTTSRPSTRTSTGIGNGLPPSVSQRSDRPVASRWATSSGSRAEYRYASKNQPRSRPACALTAAMKSRVPA